MKIAGFTFIRNCIKYDYPILEAINSILPICDEFYILVGNSEDETLQIIESINSTKIKIFHSVWNEELRSGGAVLADETNKCMDLIPEHFDWLFYIQADEVIHEKYLPIIKQEAEKHLLNKKVEGLLFNYKHFYGNYDYIGDGRSWYINEIRIIRNNKQIRSYKDAQGFRKNNKKLKVKKIDAYIYHYGYIRNPKTLFLKSVEIVKYYKQGKDYEKFYQDFLKRHQEQFDFSEIDTIEVFKETHPKVMYNRISKLDWKINLDSKKKKFKNAKSFILYYLNKWFKYRPFDYKNFIKI